MVNKMAIGIVRQKYVGFELFGELVSRSKFGSLRLGDDISHQKNDKRICKGCSRQSDDILADEWHAFGNVCPRGETRKVQALEVCKKLTNEEEIK